MEQQNTRIRMEDIPFESLERVDVSRDFVNQMEDRELNDFLNGFRSSKLYTITTMINDERYRIPAKIRLQQLEDGSVGVRVHPIQRLMIPDEFMGHRFSREEKLALLSDKRLEKTVELIGKNGKKDSYFLAIDPKTNELISLRSKSIRIPEKIKGVTLSQEQRQKLAVGKKIVLDEMTGRNGRKFSASLQIDAANRNINFSGVKMEREMNLELKDEIAKGKKPKIG